MDMAAEPIGPFRIMDCALVALATGHHARNIRELCEGLLEVPAESIYYHFWGRLLRPRFDDPEYQSDFAAWVRHALHDEVLAERLAIVDPADYADVEALRDQLVEILRCRALDGVHLAPARPDQQFHFRRCQTVVFDTGMVVHDAGELAAALPRLSLGSVYYHVIDARRREPVRLDDFHVWLMRLDGDHRALVESLAAIDPYLHTLSELRDRYAAALAGACEAREVASS